MTFQKYPTQNLEGDGNVQSNRDTHLNSHNRVTFNNYYSYSEEDSIDRGIIDEIFEFVIDQIKIKNYAIQKDNSFLNLKAKIKLNFSNINEQEEVICYFKYAYIKIKLIEQKFSQLDYEDQNDITALIRRLYEDLRSSGMSSITILKKLFQHFIPHSKSEDPKYVNLAHAFILFFLDDCTIFEKTLQEIQVNQTLFDNR